jgi:TolA-binding protein
MKSIERHKLKENDFARTVAQAREVLETRGSDVVRIGAIVVGVLVLVGGYSWWRESRSAAGNSALADALAVYEAPVAAPAAPAPGSPLPAQQPGTYPTERAKLDAALPKFLDVADKHASTEAGIAARYHAAGILADLGRYAEAEQRYQEVVSKAGSSIYARTARLGLADAQVAQGKYDSAISLYRELTTDSNSQLPVDGVLMQLGRACIKAGKKEDAQRAFNRIVEEFPQSAYAADARREIEDAKKAG